MSALVGMGAGALVLPFLLELGANASSASATINFMLLLSSASQVLQFLITGRIQIDYLLAYFALGFFSGIIGEMVIGWPAQKYHLSFILIYSVVFTLFIALFLMGGVGITQFCFLLFLIIYLFISYYLFIYLLFIINYLLLFFVYYLLLLFIIYYLLFLIYYSLFQIFF